MSPADQARTRMLLASGVPLKYRHNNGAWYQVDHAHWWVHLEEILKIPSLEVRKQQDEPRR